MNDSIVSGRMLMICAENICEKYSNNNDLDIFDIKNKVKYARNIFNKISRDVLCGGKYSCSYRCFSMPHIMIEDGDIVYHIRENKLTLISDVNMLYPYVSEIMSIFNAVMKKENICFKELVDKYIVMKINEKHINFLNEKIFRKYIFPFKDLEYENDIKDSFFGIMKKINNKNKSRYKKTILNFVRSEKNYAD